MDNPRSQRVKKVAQLATRAGRKKQGLFLAEGPQPVREALKLWLRRWESEESSATAEGHFPSLDALYFHPDALERHPDVASLLEEVRGVLFDPQRELPREGRIFLREATDEVLSAMGEAETSQGFIAVCRIPEFKVDALNPQSIQLGPVLVGLQDPGNVGTVIRTADAAGAQAVLLTPGSADPWAPKVVRSAAGSHFHLPIVTGVDLKELSESLADTNSQVLAAHGYAELSLATLQSGGSEVQLSTPTFWLLGNEAHGLSPEELELADHTVSIPLYGQAESLNVAVAGALCLYASTMAQEPAEPPVRTHP